VGAHVLVEQLLVFAAQRFRHVVGVVVAVEDLLHILVLATALALMAIIALAARNVLGAVVVGAVILVHFQMHLLLNAQTTLNMEYPVPAPAQSARLEVVL